MMDTSNTIAGTDEAWEDGTLGTDPKFAVPLPDADAHSDRLAVEQSLALQPISIRLEKSLVESFKLIAAIEGKGMRYQTLMRQALKRFADCESKRILRSVAEGKAQQTKESKAEVSEEPKSGKHKKAA